MLYRSYSFLTFIRGNASSIYTDQLYELRIGLAKRHASICITPRFGTRYKLVTPRDSQKIYTKRKIDDIDNLRCALLATLRAASDDSKSRSDGSSEVKHEGGKAQLQQKVIELDREKFGMLKERMLNVEAPEPDKTKKETEGKRTKSSDKGKQETSPEIAKKDETIAKKGLHYSDLLNNTINNLIQSFFFNIIKELNTHAVEK